MAELTSAVIPPIGPDDHVRGEGRELVLYMDLGCPRCAQTWAQVRERPLRICVRHFPVASKRPRAQALHTATEAIAIQSEDAFWILWDSLFADRGRQDDPHLWELVRQSGLDLERFEIDRRAAAPADRVKRDLHSGIRAGVVATPTAFADGVPLQGEPLDAIKALPD